MYYSHLSWMHSESLVKPKPLQPDAEWVIRKKELHQLLPCGCVEKHAASDEELDAWSPMFVQLSDQCPT